ncbi:MAG: hypothetical protein WEB52_00600 [Dehalococcoidia bacterium]
MDVPCLIEEGVDPTARIARPGVPAAGESIFVETGNPLRIQYQGQVLKTLALDLRGAIDLLLTVDPDSNSTRLVRRASFTVHVREGGGDPPATKDSVAPQLCVKRTMVQFALASVRAANNVLTAVIGLLAIAAGSSSAILLALGERQYAALSAAVVLVILIILLVFIVVSWFRRESEVSRCLRK